MDWLYHPANILCFHWRMYSEQPWKLYDSVHQEKGRRPEKLGKGFPWVWLNLKWKHSSHLADLHRSDFHNTVCQLISHFRTFLVRGWRAEASKVFASFCGMKHRNSLKIRYQRKSFSQSLGLFSSFVICVGWFIWFFKVPLKIKCYNPLVKLNPLALTDGLGYEPPLLAPAILWSCVLLTGGVKERMNSSLWRFIVNQMLRMQGLMLGTAEHIRALSRALPFGPSVVFKGSKINQFYWRVGSQWGTGMYPIWKNWILSWSSMNPCSYYQILYLLPVWSLIPSTYPYSFILSGAGQSSPFSCFCTVQL